MHHAFILLGPSGSGKTTLAEALTGESRLYADCAVPGLMRIITSTTRPPRLTEQHGREYWFRTSVEFEQDWKSGELLERATYRGNNYGLRKSDIQNVLTREDGLIIMEPQGTRTILAWKPETHLLYLLPLTEAELSERIALRGGSPEEIAQRLHDLPAEYDAIKGVVNAHHPDYVHSITNSGPLTEGIAQIRTVITTIRKRSN